MLVLLSSLALAVPPAEDDADAQAFAQALHRMTSVAEKMEAATYTLYTQEYIGGELTPLGEINVKFRGSDNVFLDFGPPHEGRKVLYRGSSWNDGRLRVDPGRFIPVLNLDPRGRLAMRGNRHWVGEVPLPTLVAQIVRDSLKINDHPSWEPKVKDLGPSTVRGEATRCFDTELPKDEDPALYAHRVQVCVNPDTGLPNRMHIWDVEDGELRLVEAYDYVGVTINPGLADADFEPETYGL